MRRIVALAACLALVGCGDDSPSPAAPEPRDAPSTIQVSSPAFGDGDPIPAKYTCGGAGSSPPLTWSGIPAAARALALVVDDPDAPDGSYTHWVVVDIPVADRGTDAGQSPPGGIALRGSGGTGWSPPCPPSGTHHYRFGVYALREPLRLEADVSLPRAITAIEEQALAWGRLTGTVAAAPPAAGGY
jgi:Raf kinase inhibitor-like YbhB/YbcL family protein